MRAEETFRPVTSPLPQPGRLPASGRFEVRFEYFHPGLQAALDARPLAGERGIVPLPEAVAAFHAVFMPLAIFASAIVSAAPPRVFTIPECFA